MRLDSLAFRLFALALAFTLLVLPIAGIAIYSLYKQEVEGSFDDRLKTLLLVIYTDSVDHALTEPGAPKDVGEPLFERPDSGWYWQIKPTGGAEGRRRLASRSLGVEELPSPFERGIEQDKFAFLWMNIEGPKGTPLRIVETIQALGQDDNGPRYSYLVAGPADWPATRITGFRNRLFVALFLVGLGLVLLTLLQIKVGLSPLQRIGRGLTAIRTGEAARLEGKLPLEVEPLQEEINALLQSNQDIIDRARTQVGNLAHALKTPLAVITNEARDEKSPLAQKMAEQARIMREQVDYYLSRAQMAARAGTVGRVSEVRPVVAGLQRTLERIYRDRGISILLDCDEGARFQGEKQDLEEMLGNLTDNACKWAASMVRITIRAPSSDSRTGRRRLAITVEDDGPGLTEEQRKRIGKRGMRLDETKPGTGLGLSIVADLATSYSGRFDLGASQMGGLKVVLDLPAA